MATCKEIATARGEPIVKVRKAAKALGFELPRGRGKTFDATPAQEKKIGAWLDTHPGRDEE